MTLRVGIIAEGQAELGYSLPYIKPEDGGKPIPTDQEGALHTLIRRELAAAGFSDCAFVQRHPSLKERRRGQRRTGHGILERKYLAQVVSVWKPYEVDLIVLLVDADDELEQRQRLVQRGLETIRSNHFDENDEQRFDRSVGGLAIKHFDAWLLADSVQIATLLAVALSDLPEDLESLPAQGAGSAKGVLETAVSQSSYLPDAKEGERHLKAKWELAGLIELHKIRNRCQQGYDSFMAGFISIVRSFADQ